MILLAQAVLDLTEAVQAMVLMGHSASSDEQAHEKLKGYGIDLAERDD